MEKPARTTRDQIEALQAWSYQHLGRDPREIPEYIDMCRYRQRAQYANDIPASRMHEWISEQAEIQDPEYRRLMDETYDRFRTTPYQDPVILRGIAHSLDDLTEAAHRLYPSECKGLGASVVATVPISLLNGFALEDDAGECGIVLQDGLRFTPFLVASELGQHFLIDHPQGVGIDLEADRIRRRLESDRAQSNTFLDTYVRDMTEPHGLALTPERFAAIMASKEAEAYVSVQKGFQSFVVAHEFAHCLRRHVRQVRPEHDGPRWARSDEEIRDVLELARSKYPSFPEADIEQFEAFAFLHALEFDADRVAFALLVDALEHRTMQAAYRLLWVLGALSFFWYAEMLERVHRTIEHGASWFDDPLYTTDLAVQSMLERPTHPAPLERGRMLLSTLIAGESADWVQKAALSSWSWLEAVFETAWSTGRHTVADAVQAKRLKVDRKWVAEVPVAAAIGIRACVGGSLRPA